MSKRLQVTLDDALYAALAAFAETQDRTPANVVKHALRGYLSRSSHGKMPVALRVRANGSGSKENDSKEVAGT